MSLTRIKKQIKSLIEVGTDEQLASVLTMLEQDVTSRAMVKRMQQVAEPSERDVKAGRVMELETFKTDTADFINELFERNEKGRSAAARRGGASKAGR